MMSSATTTTAADNNNDSTEQLFQDWLSKCLSCKDTGNDDNNDDETTGTTAEWLRKESSTAFGLFAQASSLHEERLALLIQTLGPAFAAASSATSSSSTSRQGRIAALSCLLGALEGSVTKGLSLNLIKLLGAFLLQYNGPLQLEEDSGGVLDLEKDELDEEIRDTACKALKVLLQAMGSSTPTTTTTSSSSSSSPEKELVMERIQQCMQMAQTGVDRRSAVPVYDDDDDDDVVVQKPTTVRLSQLPRSRRSLCFDLLQASVESIGRLSSATLSLSSSSWTVDESVRTEMVQFIKFVTTCLHGESDPRCLLQLLLLFHQVMISFRPFFILNENTTTMTTVVFPVTEIFDAIAPYYPIQFTPPPNNNIYGITKEKLRSAILAVLCCTDYDELAEKQNRGDDTMRNLAIGIIVEALVPPAENGPVTLHEQLEALEDLSAFLFPKHTMPSSSSSSKCMDLTEQEVTQISNALLIIHDDASKGVVEKGLDSQEGQHAKALADLCRTVVSKIAWETEKTSGNVLKAHQWKVFVEKPIRAISSALPSSPTQARTAIAYMANLCSCGGPKTLRLSLERGLMPILRHNLGDGLEYLSPDDICTAVYAVGAFFASARAAMEKSKQELGINMYPHPLLHYSANAIDKVCVLLVSSNDDTSKTTTTEAAAAAATASRPFPVRTAAIRAIESIAVASPASHFDADQIGNVCRLVRTIYTPLLIKNNDEDDSKQEDDKNQQENEEADEAKTEWLNSSAKTLGAFLAMAFGDDNKHVEESTVFEKDELQAFLCNDVLTALLESSLNEADDDDSKRPRHDRKALSNACSYSLKAANRIVASIMMSLKTSLEDNNDQTSKACAETLSFFFQEKNSMAAKAFQELAAPSVTLFDILATLAPSGNNDNHHQAMQIDSVERLQLPPTEEEKEMMNKKLQTAEEIIPQLRNAYEKIVVEHHFQDLAKFVDKSLPPLSDNDSLKISISLPLLSLAMERHNHFNGGSSENSAVQQTLHSMASDLADLALNSKHSSTRTHAAQCLHASIAYFTPRNADCTAKKIAKDIVLPSILADMQEAKKNSKETEQLHNAVADSLSMVALLGSAAAIRGASSSKTADQIILFLVDLACNKTAKNPWNDAENIDLTVFGTSDPNISLSLAVAASSSYGTILSTEGVTPLRKQRLSHISMKHINKCISSMTTSSASDRLGVLGCICHLVCSGTLKSVSSKDMDIIVGIINSGLSQDSIDATIAIDSSITKLVLASILKLLCISTESLNTTLYFVITGAMRAFASIEESESESDVAFKLLALQILQLAAQTASAQETLKAVKPAVVSILSVAMNHPSVLLRHAAVEVRNIWYLLD